MRMPSCLLRACPGIPCATPPVPQRDLFDSGDTLTHSVHFYELGTTGVFVFSSNYCPEWRIFVPMTSFREDSLRMRCLMAERMGFFSSTFWEEVRKLFETTRDITMPQKDVVLRSVLATTDKDCFKYLDRDFVRFLRFERKKSQKIKRSSVSTGKSASDSTDPEKNKSNAEVATKPLQKVPAKIVKVGAVPTMDVVDKKKVAERKEKSRTSNKFNRRFKKTKKSGRV